MPHLPWFVMSIAACRMRAPAFALRAFQEMRSRCIWSPQDTHTVNILLNALSSDLPAAFAMCGSHIHLAQAHVFTL